MITFILYFIMGVCLTFFAGLVFGFGIVVAIEIVTKVSN